MISRADIIYALKASGIKPGMTIFTHSNLAFFGSIANVYTMDDLVKCFLDAFLDVVGPHGTLVFPVFTYSFGADSVQKIFDVTSTSSTTSSIGNFLVKNKMGYRSLDPMLSVVSIGEKSRQLTSNIDTHCFGSNSIWSRLYDEDALICNLNQDSGSTFLHWVERQYQVTYRKDISMSGHIFDGSYMQPCSIVYTGHDLNDSSSSASFSYYHKRCVEDGISKKTSLGRGQIVSQSTRSAKAYLYRLLDTHPSILTQGFRYD